MCVSSNEFEWWSIYSAATFKQIYIYILIVSFLRSMAQVEQIQVTGYQAWGVLNRFVRDSRKRGQTKTETMGSSWPSRSSRSVARSLRERASAKIGSRRTAKHRGRWLQWPMADGGSRCHLTVVFSVRMNREGGNGGNPFSRRRKTTLWRTASSRRTSTFHHGRSPFRQCGF